MRPCGGYWDCGGHSMGNFVSDVVWYGGGESVVVAVVGGRGCDGGIDEPVVCCGWEA